MDYGHLVWCTVINVLASLIAMYLLELIVDSRDLCLIQSYIF